MPELDRVEVLLAVTRALAEDLADGEPDDALDVPEAETGRGVIVCRVPGVLAGVPVAREAFARVGVRLRPVVGEGRGLRAGEPVAELGGSVRAMLAARATAVAFLERLSAVASGCREPAPADPLEAYAAGFARPVPVSSDNGPRFELKLTEH
jgi:nicotinate-nucleotide pyrophosphorylase (carboxylating)